MVRVGGGWDTLAHFLDKHDPCRCRQGKSSRRSQEFVPVKWNTCLKGGWVGDREGREETGGGEGVVLKRKKRKRRDL